MFSGVVFENFYSTISIRRHMINMKLYNLANGPSIYDIRLQGGERRGSTKTLKKRHPIYFIMEKHIAEMRHKGGKKGLILASYDLWMLPMF